MSSGAPGICTSRRRCSRVRCGTFGGRGQMYLFSPSVIPPVGHGLWGRCPRASPATTPPPGRLPRTMAPWWWTSGAVRPLTMTSTGMPTDCTCRPLVTRWQPGRRWKPWESAPMPGARPPRRSLRRAGSSLSAATPNGHRDILPPGWPDACGVAAAETASPPSDPGGGLLPRMRTPSLSFRLR